MSHRGNKKIFLLTSSLIIACLLLLVSSPACINHQMHPLTIENQTGQALQIYVSAVYVEDYSIEKVFHLGTVPANKTIKIRDSAIIPHGGYDYIIEAKNDKDDVLFSQLYTTDELEEINWKIVIPSPFE